MFRLHGTSRFRARHSGVSNPSLGPGFRGFQLIVSLRSSLVVGIYGHLGLVTTQLLFYLSYFDIMLPLFTPL